MKQMIKRLLEKDEQITDRYFSKRVQFALKIAIILFGAMGLLCYVLYQEGFL